MSFNELSALIQQLNIHDDAIIMDSKIRDLADYFQDVFNDEQQLKDAFAHFNRLALADSKFAMNLALFFASRILDSVLCTGSAVRAELLTVLQQNYMDADALKAQQPQRFYNSITLLGEYYNRARIAANPVQILGQSLLQLLAEHLRADVDAHLQDPEQRPDVRFVKLILRQITLNGQLARPNHAAEIDALLFEVRRCLVLVDTLCPTTRALLLMTLDLYYSNFGSVGKALEALYVTYLSVDEEDERQEGASTVSNGLGIGIGLQANVGSSSTGPVISSITGLGNELNKQGSGYQRPMGIRQEFVNRPLKAADRLRFVRKQTTDELEQDEHAVREQQRRFEESVAQKQQQEQQRQLQLEQQRDYEQQQLQEQIEYEQRQQQLEYDQQQQQLEEQQLAYDDQLQGHPRQQEYYESRLPESPTKLHPQDQYARQQSQTSQQQISPNRPRSRNNRKNQLNSQLSSPQSPQSPRQQPPRSTSSSVHSSPSKTPSSRRRPLVTPVEPTLNSDWFTEVEEHFSQGFHMGFDAQVAPEIPNGAANGRSPPGKYSDSVSPNSSHGRASHRRQQRDNGSGGGSGRASDGWQVSPNEDSGIENANRGPLSPGSQARRGNGNGHSKGGRMGGGNGGIRSSSNSINGSGRNNRNNRNGNSRRNNDSGDQHNGADSMYASRTSLQSSASFRNRNGGEDGGDDIGQAMKPANRNNPFDRRSSGLSARLGNKSSGVGDGGGFVASPPRRSKHSQHCDRSDSTASAAEDSSDWHQSRREDERNPHAAQCAKEFLQFLDD